MDQPVQLAPALTTDQLAPRVFRSLNLFNKVALNLAGGYASNRQDGEPATFGQEEAQRRFVSYVLTGLDPDTRQQTQVDLDCYRANRPQVATRVMEIRGDFDSCLFASDNLPYAHPLMLIVWPPRYMVNQTLKQTYKLPGADGREARMRLQDIPNIPFASCASKHIVRVYLPAEWRDTGFVYEEAWADRLYDTVTYPVIRQMHRRGLNIEPHRFPSTSKSEHFRATRRSGRPVHSEFTIAPDLLPEFSRRFIRLLHRQPWGENGFFFHQLRQTKGFGNFRFGDRERAEVVLRDVTQYFSNEDLHVDRGRPPTVDIGMEFGRAGHVTLIRSLGHARIVHHIINQAGQTPETFTMEQVENLRRIKSHFVTDSTALMNEAAGFRSTQSYDSGIEYIQAYNTEKNPTYLVDNGRYAKFIQPREILALYRKGITTIDHMEAMCTIFEDCAKKTDSYPARVEPRVAFEKAYDYSISQEIVREVSFCIPNKIWWMSKLLRQRACKIALEWILQADTSSLSRPGVLMLIGILVYISNALCARPEEGDFGKLVRHAALPHTNGEPVQRCGMFFMRQLDFLDDGCPTIVDTRGTHNWVHSIFYFGSKDDLINFLFPSTSLISIPAHIREARKGISHNKSVITKKIYLPDNIEPEFNFPEEDDFVELPVVEDINGDPINDLSLFVTNVWRQLFADLGEKSWQPRARETPYTRRTREEKKNMVLFYSGDELERRFRCVAFRNQKYKEDWDKTFENLFPGPDHCFPGRMQGYSQMLYFNQYMSLRIKCMQEGVRGESELETIRTELKKKFNKLTFMPYAQSTRLFDSRQQRGGHIRIPRDHTGPCPIIAINPRWSALIEEKYTRYDTDDDDDNAIVVEWGEPDAAEESDGSADVELHELVEE